MGLFPYITPEENRRCQQRSQHYSHFLERHGYLSLSGIELNAGPFVRDGIEYDSGEAFFAGVRCYPLLKKGGEHFGWYEPAKRHGYADPFLHEIAFLKSLGYEQWGRQFDRENPHADYELGEKFYLKNGWIPRWTKNGKQYGHESLLTQHEYRYPGDDQPYVLCAGGG